jgi:hypothetical protein
MVERHDPARSGFGPPFTPDQQKATMGRTDIPARGRHQQNMRAYRHRPSAASNSKCSGEAVGHACSGFELIDV